MAIDKKTVEYVSYLARIDLQVNELEKLSSQLQGILDFIDQLKKLDVEGVLPTSHILPIKNVLRKDAPDESLPADKVLSNAPAREGNFFSVPKVIE